ncbi:MAG TPA: CDP-diacylglycerol--serine O-phosphatidyltransferase [Syntrophorhabdaceae bacterium]|nr:CDP-diacylglycerol--serine O-phosphatidyltransferase [Syntrophorhabdaceae bacterium]HPP06471.1 CDP-diacylglycerol--serine O-phosphatidyltransferase [Syntrophorhabdaceae bacterium]
MRKKKGKGIYILPNILTSISLLSGFYSIVSAIDRKFIYASIAVFISGIFDMLDGRVARLTGASSRFGVEYDSLCDLIAFGVAPGLLVYLWALKGYGRFGWLAAFLYVACGALRLARFNIQVDNVQRKYFLGLPIPAAAITIAGSVLFYSWLGFKSELKTIVMPIMVYLLAFLMVSEIKYYSFKDIPFFKGKPFHSTITVVLLLVIIFIEPKVTLFILASLYLLSGPIYTLFVRKKAIFDEEHRLREHVSEKDGLL